MKSALTVVLFRLFTIGVFVDGKEVSVTEGDSVTLKSGFTVVQTDDDIEWRFNGRQIATISRDDSDIWVEPDGSFRGRLQLDNQTGDLKISNISTTDSGQYKLKISRNENSPPEMIFIVKVVSADEAKPVSVLEGDSVTLHADPTYTQRYDVIQWRFGQQKSLVAEINRKAGIFNTYDVPDGRFRDRLQLDNQTGSLNITDTRTTHSGLYEADIISTSSRYTIHHTQSFTVTVRADVESMSVLKGDYVTLRTSFTKTQIIEQIRWTFGDDGELIADLNNPVNKKWNNIGLNNQTGDLTISNIQTDQYGDYKVQINTRTMTLHRKYQIIDAVKSVSVKEGDSVTLLTVTELQKDDQILWMFRDTVLAEIHKADQRFYISKGPDERFRDRLKLDNQTGSLIITDTRTTDFGLYELKINSSRRTINRRFIVTVTDAVKLLSVTEGKTVTLQTDVTKIQKDDQIFWMYGDIGLAEINKTAQRFYTYDGPAERFRDRLQLDHQTGSLNITNTTTTDSGDYKLKISRSRHTINRRINVTVTAVPDSGWSSAAVAGIGVGVLLLAAAAVVGVIYDRRRSSRNVNGQNPTSNGTQNPGDHVNEGTELTNAS